jgi:hypothetical protein
LLGVDAGLALGAVVLLVVLLRVLKEPALLGRGPRGVEAIESTEAR